MWIRDIGVWGDSITYGVGDREALGWVGRLRRRVERDHAISVYNFGVSGDTSADLVKRFEVELASINPQLVLIAIGTNDSMFKEGDPSHTRVPIDTYRQHLRALFTQATKVPHVFALGLTNVEESLVQPVPWSKTKKSYANRHIDEYDDALCEEAISAGVGYIPLHALLAPADLADGLHPNAVGYEKMYGTIHEAIRHVLG